MVQWPTYPYQVLLPVIQSEHDTSDTIYKNMLFHTVAPSRHYQSMSEECLISDSRRGRGFSTIV